jgi:hypothetical protein
LNFYYLKHYFNLKIFKTKYYLAMIKLQYGLCRKLDFHLFIFGNSFSLCRPGWLGTPYIAQDSLKLVILLPQPPECWDYRPVPPHPN